MIITRDELARAVETTLWELHRHGFLTNRVLRTKVSLVLAGWRHCGWQQEWGTGDILIPSVVGREVVERIVHGRRYSDPLTYTIRHEYGHAVAYHHPGLVRSRRFREAFGGPHGSVAIPGQYLDPRVFITEYAATNPCEDFAETFAAFLTAGGRIASEIDTRAIRRKWRFVEAMGEVLASGRRRW